MAEVIIHTKKSTLAPIASVEEFIEDNEKVLSPGGCCHEHVDKKECFGCCLDEKFCSIIPAAPRIDISRASSSPSNDEDCDSKDSTPEKELFAAAEFETLPSKILIGYRDDVRELRASTEELETQDPINKQDFKRECQRLRRNVKNIRKCSDVTDYETAHHAEMVKNNERKGSNCSEIVLLNISGRTSRLSSVCSQGSELSENFVSVRGSLSRSPSPQNRLLETSFCGSISTLIGSEFGEMQNDDLVKRYLEERDNFFIPAEVYQENTNSDRMSNSPRERRREYSNTSRRTRKDHTDHISQEPAIKPTTSENLIEKATNESRADVPKSKACIISSLQSQLRASIHSHEKIKIAKKIKASNKGCIFHSIFNILKQRKPKESLKKDEFFNNQFEENEASNKTRANRGNSEETLDHNFSKFGKNDYIFLSLHKDGDGTSYSQSSEQSELKTVRSFKEDEIIEQTYSTDEKSNEITNDMEVASKKNQKLRMFQLGNSTAPNSASESSLEKITSQKPFLTSSFSDDELVCKTTDSIEGFSNCDIFDVNFRRERRNTSYGYETSFLSNVTDKDADKIGTENTNPFVVNEPVPKQHEPHEPKQEKIKTYSAPITNNRNCNGVADESTQKFPEKINVDDDNNQNSSDSAANSDTDFFKPKTKSNATYSFDEKQSLCCDDNVEEELPYIPTTLPLEKSNIISILPAPQRQQYASAIRAIERPHKSSSINPQILDEFIQQKFEEKNVYDKMQISVPFEENGKSKLPKKKALKSFREFSIDLQHNRQIEEPLSSCVEPDSSVSHVTASELSSWVNFEEIPEKRKLPKYIQIIPKYKDVGEKSRRKGNAPPFKPVLPKNCVCECHQDHQNDFQQCKRAN